MAVLIGSDGLDHLPSLPQTDGQGPRGWPCLVSVDLTIASRMRQARVRGTLSALFFAFGVRDSLSLGWLAIRLLIADNDRIVG